MYNNYNNPYFTPTYRPIEQPYTQQPIQQAPIQQPKTMLQGKLVDNVEVVKATDIPMDGSISYFPLADNSAIVTKQLNLDGTSKVVIFKPVQEEKEEVKYVTPEELKKTINGLNLDELEDIKEDIKEIKKQLKKKGD